MSFKNRLLKCINFILCMRTKFFGENPFFSIFHHQYLAIKEHNYWVKIKINSFYGNLIDYGCGSKPYEQFIPTANYIGVDLASNALADSHVIDGWKIPFDDASIDCLISTQVLEHVENLELVVQDWKRVLKPDAKVLVTVPFMYSVHGLPYDFRRFTKEGLRIYFETNGFEILEERVFGGIGSYLVLGIQNWIEGQPSRGMLIFKVLFSLMYPIYSLCFNLIGLQLNRMDNTKSFYTSAGVLLRKK